MLSSFEWTEKLNALGAGKGIRVYDLELPQGRSGKFRVFLWKSVQSENRDQVSLEECIQFARAMRTLPELRMLEEAGAGLEVSSPGINRRLRTEEHFAAACGEHVVLKIFSPQGAQRLSGELLEFCSDSSTLKILADVDSEKRDASSKTKRGKKKNNELLQAVELPSEVSVALADVVEARVEYLFRSNTK
jgi:ribosome maturation factor RimP